MHKARYTESSSHYRQLTFQGVRAKKVQVYISKEALRLVSLSSLDLEDNYYNTVITRAPPAVPMLICQGPSLYFEFLVKKGHNSKTIPFRVMPLVLQLHLVMMNKHSKISVDTFDTY